MSGVQPSDARPSGPPSGDEQPADQGPAPVDPMRGLRGVFAATLILEAIVVALALLVLAKFSAGATGIGVPVIVGLAVAMVVAAGLQRRPWGLWLALGLQLAMIVSGLLVPVLGWLGGVFALVWFGLLMFRRDVAGRMARGELPVQQ